MRSIGAVTAAAASLLSLTAASTLTPPVLPLFVRNPYLSTWLANAREEPWTRWPMFYTGSSIGLAVLAAVPESSIVYPLLGRPQDSLDGEASQYNISYPTYRGAQYDASTTNLSYSIPSPSGGQDTELVLSFLSPITPTSTMRQSIPAGYLTVYVKGSFDLDIYIDVNGQWVNGNRGSKIEWSLAETDYKERKHLKTWKVKRQTEQLFTEWGDQAEWGTLHFAAPADVSHEAGISGQLRQRFSKTGVLQNTVDDDFRGIMEEEPVFAFSKRFNLSSSHSSPKATASVKEDSVLFTISHIQDPVVQFAAARGLTYMRPLWESYFSSDEALVTYHYLDYSDAAHLAAKYSAQLARDAYASGSDNYMDIVALSARQVMGATSFSGTPANPILFLKEISSNGNSQTVDVIFPAFPFFLYTNPRWLAYMLEPLLEHMLSGQYPNAYTMHDLGTHFPNMTGHADGKDEYMPVEECGDMLIMGLALVNSLSNDEKQDARPVWSTVGAVHSTATLDVESDDVSPFFLPTALGTQDGISGLDNSFGGKTVGSDQGRKWLSRSYTLWKQWTAYLVDYSLEPHNQLCTDDFAGWLALQTNLALKGIVGIKAMSELAVIAEEKDDAKHFRNISEVYVKKWEEYGMSRDGGRAKLAYDWYGSWTTLYSLYADALLCFHPTSNYTQDSAPEPNAYAAGHQQPLKPSPGASGNFIPDHIYTTQSRWYTNVMQKYGLPLDSRHLYTKSDWAFQAAAVASKKTRTRILESVAKWLNETVTDRPFTDLYKTEERGGFPGPNFFARPVVGSHFAFLALERACGGSGAKAFAYEE
ncbi:hypothetical protein LTR53_017308 [Teratosphaeriaceae sp. CCFEE 6253]|nr:hypothetical protein LTR53_017308 [Teratosphaeriaceae sp. CCFEE 6253]